MKLKHMSNTHILSLHSVHTSRRAKKNIYKWFLHSILLYSRIDAYATIQKNGLANATKQNIKSLHDSPFI